ncbi:aa3-type cytochrome c oxidase subunit IV [Stakelama saccharophila]|uniref:Aa3-type cytochrome c oxidase subunit IV n=1 Tax=Stakelama saccharophila TaxID=3075605 RepID=A0ABZ0B8I9_9SPHN|nr:aa3-type cytochrome c oxidase subunit IV [Stakelama sp. W311]WNO53583.1 aa3-type cytochrome c oxidase subunit IV [Stakelama sp. W311]
MAGDGEQLQAHEQTYHSIMRLMRVGAIACFVIALIVVWLIAP